MTIDEQIEWIKSLGEGQKNRIGIDLFNEFFKEPQESILASLEELKRIKKNPEYYAEQQKIIVQKWE